MALEAQLHALNREHNNQAFLVVKLKDEIQDMSSFNTYQPNRQQSCNAEQLCEQQLKNVCPPGDKRSEQSLRKKQHPFKWSAKARMCSCMTDHMLTAMQPCKYSSHRRFSCLQGARLKLAALKKSNPKLHPFASFAMFHAEGFGLLTLHA
eukprot:scaffold63764_cov17-Tisochrysis_lutea.AAC.2